ncbi:OLC1v1008556C1 [Oldenlandia corymbosa var. corymbosa]|uniref:OLC1v1008556C1 n=1 Tax=Oldenlandia corymbosa var. corymbosa TaxID=529605 RepID=A0AAV1DND9_OLDCO|nr:OLC1v1008556C1 [Oldenlandia corymbosa var. corymbosa]
MAERMKRLQKELRKLKDEMSPLEGSGHRHAVTRHLYAEHRMEKEKNLKKLKNVHPTFGPHGESANVDDDDDFEGEEEEEDSFESGGDDVDEEDEAAEYFSPERRDIHFRAYTPGGSSVRVGPQSTFFKGPSTTLHHVGPQSDLFRGVSTTLHDTGPLGILFGGPSSTLHDVDPQHRYGGTSAHPPLTSEPRSRFGAASIGASSRPKAAATSSGTSRRSKVSNEEIDDWVMTDDVSGGPCDGSMIPSFLGHTAYQLWNGETRDYLTMKPTKKSLS